MGRFRDGRGPGSELAEHEGEDDELAPGRKTLTGQLGKPSTGKPPSVPGRRSLTLALPIQRAVETEQGVALPDAATWSQRVGADVGGARLVTGPAAAEAAAALHTRAFTIGNRVFFGAGFDATTDGGELLAHELTHVAQQKGAGEPASLDELPVLDHGDEREVAAREHKPGLASGLAIARDTTVHMVAVAPNAKPGPDPGAAAQTMAQGLPLITKRWKAIGLDLFTPMEKPQNVPPLAEFESGAYGLITGGYTDELAAAIVDVDPVNIVLGGPNRQQYLKALQHAREDFMRDRPLFEAIKADVDNVLAGGQVQFNATRIMAHQSALSANGRRAFAKPECLPTKKLIAYIAKDAFEHGEMESKTVDYGWIKREGGGKARVADCQAMLKTLQTGAPADVVVNNPGTTEPTKEAKQKAGELMKVIDKLLAAATKRKGELLYHEIKELEKALEDAGPDGREVAWGNKVQVGKVIQLLDDKDAKRLIESLDPVETLYKKCESVVGGDETDKTKSAIVGDTKIPSLITPEQREVAMKGLKLKAGGSVYGALHEFLVAHLADQPMRMRLLQHTKLKNLYIDRLAPDNGRVIYRMIVRGSETPTPEDMVHEAAEKHEGANVVRGLRALAGNDPVRLAALERDPVFRQLIEKLTEEVDVDGNIVRPYQLCMTMWGRQVGVNEDPNAVSRIETNPGADEKPLTIPERIKLNRELFDPCLDELWDEISNAHFKRRVEAAKDNVVTAQQVQFDAVAKKTADPQIVRDVLVKYDHKAQGDPHQALLRRDHVMWAAELEKRFYQKYSQDLRAWIYEKSGPVNRTGAMRVLGLEQGAGVGMFNGQIVAAGEASVKDKMPLEQALRETLRDGQPLAEICSVESRVARSAMDDHNKGALYGAYIHLEASVNQNADSLFKLTGIHVRAIDLMRNAFMLHSGHFETRLAEKFQGQELADVRQTLGLTADVDKVPGAPPPSLEQQGEQRFGQHAKLLWDQLNLIQPGAPRAFFGPAAGSLEIARNLAPLEGKADDKPSTTAKAAAPGQAGHDIEERPPRTFNGYYQLHYGVTPELHAAAMVKAQATKNGFAADEAATLLGIRGDHLKEWIAMASEQLVAKPEDGSIGPHNQHLVRASFTVEIAKGHAKSIWEILHSDGKLQLIETEHYGPFNDEEQRLIRVHFRALSGGFDLTFYIRQAIEQRQRSLRAAESAGGAEKYYGVEKAKQQNFMIGGEGTEAGDTGFFSAVHTMGDDAELDRALAVAQHGEIDARTRVRNAVQRKDDGQVVRIIDDLDDGERKQVFADGELMTALNKELSQQNYDRVFKVLTGQADLADRMLSRTIGNTWWKKHVSGKPDQEGMKEDVRTYIRKLRLQIDKQVRAEAVEKLKGRQPTNDELKSIDQEVIKRVHEQCGAIAAGSTEKDILDKVLNEEDRAEIQAIMLHDGEAKDFALVGGKSAAEIIGEIHGMKAKERQDKLADPAYMQMLGEKLTNEKDYREALNALNQIGEGPDNLSALDAKSRSKEQTNGAAQDPRETLRALAKLSTEELEHVKSDPAMQAQIMAALENPK